MKQESISLLTGIPRSGTTLCCKLLNDVEQVIALHEPIRPAQISVATAIHDIQSQTAAFYVAIRDGNPFEHGDQGGLDIENPVGIEQNDGVRKVIAQRGNVRLPPQQEPFSLVIKQNAMFTALLPKLLERYKVVAVVRNPVDVLLSWLTVDLPVNRGALPGGERFDQKLRTSLHALSDTRQRQWQIYQWFSSQFRRHQDHGLKVVRYEDIIVSQGQVLRDAVFGQNDQRQWRPRPLALQTREFAPKTLSQLAEFVPLLSQKGNDLFYSDSEIHDRLANVI